MMILHSYIYYIKTDTSNFYICQLHFIVNYFTSQLTIHNFFIRQLHFIVNYYIFLYLCKAILTDNIVRMYTTQVPLYWINWQKWACELYNLPQHPTAQRVGPAEFTICLFCEDIMAWNYKSHTMIRMKQYCNLNTVYCQSCWSPQWCLWGWDRQ